MSTQTLPPPPALPPGATPRATPAGPTPAGARSTAGRHAVAPAFLRRRRPGSIGAIHIGQIFLIEAVVVGVVAALVSGPIAALAAAVAGAVLLTIVLARSRGRWWLERRMVRRRFGRRVRAAAGVPPGTDAGLTDLRRLAPALSILDVTVGGEPVGVAWDGAGWFAAAAVDDEVIAGALGTVPLEALADAILDAGQPGAVVQFVLRTVPVDGGINPSSPAAESYRTLLAQFGNVPAAREAWVAVRLDARALAEAGVGPDTDLTPAPVVVASLLRKVGKVLRRAGVPEQTLDAAALLEALARTCDLLPETRPEGARPREDWTVFHANRVAHRSFWVRGWPAVAQASAALGLLSSPPGAESTVALVLDPDDTSVDVTTLVRVSAPLDRLVGASRAFSRGARRAGTDLIPLDGDQGPAVYATAPTGGGAR
jgi:type VII secretion protein EccE